MTTMDTKWKIGVVVALVIAIIGTFTPKSVTEVIRENLGATSTTNSGLVINEDGTDDDTRIEGDTNANLVYVDAGNDRVAVGTSTPDRLFHVTANTGTTTPKFGAETASATCIELTTNANALVGAYVVGTSWVIDAGGCN